MKDPLLLKLHSRSVKLNHYTYTSRTLNGLQVIVKVIVITVAKVTKVTFLKLNGSLPDNSSVLCCSNIFGQENTSSYCASFLVTQPAFQYRILYCVMLWITFAVFSTPNTSLTSVYGLPHQNITFIHFLLTALKGTDNRSPVNPPPNREFYWNKTTGKKVHKVYVFRIVRPDMVQSSSARIGECNMVECGRGKFSTENV